jgi:hypothetical protein
MRTAPSRRITSPPRTESATTAPPLLVKGILGMLDHTYLWFEPDGELPPEAPADEYVDLLLRGIRVSS